MKIIDSNIIQKISSEQAWHYRVCPESEEDGCLLLYSDQVGRENQIRIELNMIFSQNIEFNWISTEGIDQLLLKYYRKSNKKGISLTVDDAYDETFITKLISESREFGSSDIHIEIYDEKARIRLRIDGALIERYVLREESYQGLVSVIKLKSGMDIAEKRKPQDGRYTHQIGEEQFDLRVSVLPTLRGEKIVMRILSNDSTDIELADIGLSNKELQRYREGIYKPEGIILISGPTGSGKTSTLYATLKELNSVERNIMTVEDPVEYTLEGVNQVQVKEDIGLTFAAALRSFLRQDPDVIMLGEIRDEVTAQMAIRAALTGHLVLSTIHTNSAWEITSRLVDMGVPDFLVAGTLKLAVAQRLVRKLCECKESTSEKIEFPSNYVNDQPKTHYKPKGCEKCHYTGFKGRIAVFEIIPIDREFSDSIKSKSSILAERNIFKDKDILLLADNAFALFEDGKTSYQEIYPILASNF